MMMKGLITVRRAVAAALCGLAMTLGAVNVSAANPRVYAVEASANVLTAPPQVQISWPADSSATGYTIYRKVPTSSSWTQIATAGGSATSYADGNVTLGATFEYRIRKSTSAGYTGHGYVLAGVNAPLIENRGKMVLLVDMTHATTLAPELARLESDLAGDGWTVIRKNVSPTASAPSVKALIKAEYDADPTNVKSVFIFGHVAVPRSGNIRPDGHPDHEGAWAADTYYADMNGSWTDSSVNNTVAERPDNDNIPGDGKFDQSTIPSDLELQVGRVDLSNLTCFANKLPSRTEVDLLRQYLNKDHNFRHGRLNLPRRGLVVDDFGDRGGEAFAATGWRSFAPMFGAANNVQIGYGTYFSTLNQNGYLFSYGTGGGSYWSANGVGNSDDFAMNDIKSTFTMLFGSYFGDFDNESNFLRAALGSSSHTLTVAWAGRPHWYLHHMALGETIGHSARISQNNNGVYEHTNTGARGVHTALLGDPSLRLHPVMSPSNLLGSKSGAALNLSWTGSGDTNIQGYHVYRAATGAGPFTRLTTSLLGTTAFTDAAALSNAVYMVRAVKLENASSGAYYNPSQGVFFTNGVVTLPSPPPTPTVANVATFVKTDTNTLGNWKNVYGSQGHLINGASSALPAYANVTSVGSAQWVWSHNAGSDPSALLLPGQTTTRVAGCWYAATQFLFDLKMTDTNSHRFSAYFLDWDEADRHQRVDILDPATGAILDTRNLSNFANGAYLTWDVKGNVLMRVTRTWGANGVVSAIFFDAAPGAPVPPPVEPAPTAPAAPGGLLAALVGTNDVKLSWSDLSTNETGFKVFRKTGATGAYAEIAMTGANTASFTNSGLSAGTTYFYKIAAFNSVGDSGFSGEANATTAAAAAGTNTATFLGSDSTTGGTWPTKYGADAYFMNGGADKAAGYAKVTAHQCAAWIWNWNISDPAAVLLPGSLNNQGIASCWYSSAPFNFQVAINDGSQRRLSAYFLDWDDSGRQQLVEILDMNTGAILDSRTISNFANGVYLSWRVKGKTQIRVTPISGPNAVVSALFLDTN